MDHTKMPMSEVLTPDEKLVADFIKTRTKKVLDDIQRLSKEQNADISEWAESFAYLARTYGRDSDETFKWFKYYFREGMIPANVALPLVVQVYLDSSVDGGFSQYICQGIQTGTGRCQKSENRRHETGTG